MPHQLRKHHTSGAQTHITPDNHALKFHVECTLAMPCFAKKFSLTVVYFSQNVDMIEGLEILKAILKI